MHSVGDQSREAVLFLFIQIAGLWHKGVLGAVRGKQLGHELIGLEAGIHDAPNARRAVQP